MKGIGVVFNINDLGGYYGDGAWRIFMRNLCPQDIIGCVLREGDTKQTLNGDQREYCIAVCGLTLDDATVRKAFETSSERGLAPSARRFVSNPGSEPLVDAGHIDSLGRLVEDEWSRISHDRCKDCGWGYAPTSITAELSPELESELENLRGRKAIAGAQQDAKKRAEKPREKLEEAREGKRTGFFERLLPKNKSSIKEPQTPEDIFGNLETYSAKPSQVIADCTKAIEMEPGTATYYFMRAEVYLAVPEGKGGDLEAALRDYNKVIDLNPEFVKAYVRRAVCLNLLGDKGCKEYYALAVADYETLLRLAPDDPDIAVYRGIIGVLNERLGRS